MAEKKAKAGSTTKTGAPAKKAAKPGRKATTKSTGGAAQPKTAFVGQAETLTMSGVTLQPSGAQLPQLTWVAFRVKTTGLPPYLYGVHLTSSKSVRLLCYTERAQLVGASGAALRIPQTGSWLCTPSAGAVWLVGSDRPLSFEQLEDIARGKSAGPGSGTKGTLVHTP